MNLFIKKNEKEDSITFSFLRLDSQVPEPGLRAESNRAQPGRQTWWKNGPGVSLKGQGECSVLRDSARFPEPVKLVQPRGAGGEGVEGEFIIEKMLYENAEHYDVEAEPMAGLGGRIIGALQQVSLRDVISRVEARLCYEESDGLVVTINFDGHRLFVIFISALLMQIFSPNGAELQSVITATAVTQADSVRGGSGGQQGPVPL